MPSQEGSLDEMKVTKVQCPCCQGHGSVMSPASAAALMRGECVNPVDVDCPRCHREGFVEVHAVIGTWAL
jgi:RecJ-like exonuclease